MFLCFGNNPHLTSNFSKFLIVQNNSKEHHHSFLKLHPVLGVNVHLEILLKNREIEYLYGSKETTYILGFRVAQRIG